MYIKALRRGPHAGLAVTQLATARRSGHRLVDGRAATSGDRLVGRWTVNADGRLVVTWAREPARRRLIDRKRGSDA